MLYLEDYLEMIEHLPQELKDRFTEIRELDLEVQNASDKIEERMKTFFRGAKKLRISDRDLEFEAIRKDFYKVLDNADEKANQTNELYNLVDRYLRKLDQELHKFKMELEADNAGITEVLEKRSLEMDANERNKEKKNSQKENRYQTANLSKSEKKSERKNSYEKAGSSVGYHYPTSSGSGSSTPLPYNQLGHPGLGGNAIAAAASQAIAATQQMQQGRRTASLKASYDAVHLGLVQPTEFTPGGGVGGRELLVNEELHYAAQQALAATTSDRIGTGGGSAYEQKRNKRKSQHLYNPLEFMGASSVPPEEREELFAEIEEGSMELAPIAPAVDPNEPRYCLCNDVSHGDMVGCDNEACPIEWFHYGCVGITTAPKGKWYCPQCSASMKRRGRKAADNR